MKQRIRQIFGLLPQLKSNLIGAVAFAIVLEVLKLVPPYFLKIAVDLLISPSPQLSEIYLYAGGILVVSLLATMLEQRSIISSANSQFDMETGLLKRAHEKLLTLGLSFHESHPSGSLVHLMNKGAGKLAELMWFVNDQFIGAFIQIILTCIVLVFIHPAAGLLFMAFMPVVLWLTHRTGQRVQPYRIAYHSMFQRANWEMNQSLLNIRTVKDYVQEDRERTEYVDLLEKYRQLGRQRISFESKDIFTREIMLGFTRFAVFFYSVYLVYLQQMTPGSLVLFTTLSEKVVASLYRLGRLYSHLGDAFESIDQFCAVFEAKPDVISKPNALTQFSTNGKIDFENVSFTYGSGSVVLTDINLSIPAKRVVAFVGRSGAGKSTMIKLICRHYDVTSGVIKLDDIDIRNIQVADYRRKIAVVSQDVELFDASVFDNIAYGLAATQEQVEEAARLAHAHDFIQRLPQGYATRVGERGIRLSGGQKQRVGIARALLVEPSVIIFDEATSSLDTESEQLIQQALRGIASRQTMIVIAHRLSTIATADLIVVFDQGKIIETGTYEVLMQKQGFFAHMRQLQTLGLVRS